MLECLESATNTVTDFARPPAEIRDGDREYLRRLKSVPFHFHRRRRLQAKFLQGAFVKFLLQ